ncbi:hypothetical protein ACFVU0_18080 [Streptomyces sp. NPDC058122]|uniref:hypothetical protein n=1 Tax=Streptomyces sp. NPDC058122 TaxID=3346349 RepID=UPI0036E2CFCC
MEDAPGIRERHLAALISDLIHVHDPTPAVIVLGTVVPDEVIEAVVEAYRRCRQSDVLISVATPSAPARRTLQAAAVGGGLVVHACVDTAVRTADAAAAVN